MQQTPPPDLVIGSDGYPVGTSGNGWSYDNNTDTLTLTSRTFDLSTTETVECVVKIQSGATITGGTFAGSVKNWSTISGGTFQKMCSVTNYGNIEKGTFEGSVTNGGAIDGGKFEGTVINNSTISDGAFTDLVDNKYIIKGGTFRGEVTNSGTITGDGTTFEKLVTNNGNIYNGTFEGSVTNRSTIRGGTFQNTCSVENWRTIEKGTFNGKVSNNQGGNITNGTFEQEVINNAGGEISGGTFKGTVLNGNGIITGGTFAAGLSKNDGSVTGGIFNGKTGLTDALQVTVTNGSVSQVNDEGPLNADGTTGTAWDLYSYKDTTMTITADTEIFSLNGKPIGDGNCTSSYGSDKTTVIFTMPDANVVLGTGELVMENGYPVGTSGKGWSYDNSTETLTLTSGTFDFSSTEPVKCKILLDSKSAIITGGTFEKLVVNDGYIEKGTFNGTVENSHGKIYNGTFNGKVTNNDGTILGGIFAGSVENKEGWIYGGVFNGKTGLGGVTGLLSITVASGAKITEVNGVSADWKPYVVVTSYATTNEVIITADTEIFSLNGYPIDGSPYDSSYPDTTDKKTVKFTRLGMLGDGVVLNGAITCTNLVMENGWPQASKDGQISCSGTDWSYDKNTKTLTLTSGTFDFSTTQPVQCEIEIQSSRAEITGGTFAGSVTNKGTIKNGSFEQEVTNNAGGEISGGTFYGTVTNSGYIKDGTFNGKVTNRNTIENGTFAGSVTNEGTIKNGSFEKKVTNSNTIMDGVFKGVVENGGNGTIFGGTFAGSVNNSYGGHIFGGVFNGHINVPGFGVYPITVDTASSKAEIKEVNGVSAVWEPYVVVTELTKNQKVIITASTKIYSLNHKPLSTDNCNSAHDGNENTVKFTMPNANVVLNGAITSTDLVMENGWPKDSDGGKKPCKGDGWEYIKNDPTNGDMLLLTGSNQTGGLFDFSTIGDGSAVECNVFVGKPTAITGGEFNGKVINNSHILGGTFHGEVDNTTMGTIKGGTFNGAVENNGIIEKGTFNGAVTGSGTVSESITGSGTLNGELITKTPEPEPEPTTYTVTVIGGTIDGKTSVSAKENDTLTVVLDQNDIPDGMTFDLWSISSSKLSGDINVDYRAEAMTFQMPAEDVTIRAQYRSAEIIEDAAPSPLATAATIAVGGAAAGIVVWQGVNLGVDLYLANALPQGVPVPTDRRALALLLWETAGKPEVALPTLYGDIPAEEIELQKATRWAVQNGLMDAADKKDASFFDPDHYVTKMDVFGAWLRLKKLLGTIGTSPTQ